MVGSFEVPSLMCWERHEITRYGTARLHDGIGHYSVGVGECSAVSARL
jgi:hypothetical protein